MKKCIILIDMIYSAEKIYIYNCHKIRIIYFYYLMKNFKLNDSKINNYYEIEDNEMYYTIKENIIQNYKYSNKSIINIYL